MLITWCIYVGHYLLERVILVLVVIVFVDFILMVDLCEAILELPPFGENSSVLLHLPIIIITIINNY